MNTANHLLVWELGVEQERAEFSFTQNNSHDKQYYELHLILTSGKDF